MCNIPILCMPIQSQVAHILRLVASLIEASTPKKFYLVMPFGSEEPEQQRAVADLSEGVLHGVQGISDTSAIIMQWLGVSRDAILVMDMDKVISLNNLSRVQYNNPNYLTSRGMKPLFRLLDLDPSSQMDRESLARKLLGQVPKTYTSLATSGLASRLADSFGKGVEDITTVNLLVKRVLEVLAPIKGKSAEELRKLSKEEFKQMLLKALEGVGDSYASEGEWLVKDKKLTIPPGSRLFIRKPGVPKDLEERYLANELTDMDKDYQSYHVKQLEEFYSTIKDNKLEDKYPIRYIDSKRFEHAQGLYEEKKAAA